MFRTVKRRNGKTVDIPVGEDGYVPLKALQTRQAERAPRSQIIDGMQTHKTVRPIRLTPEEAASWWLYPGRSDIAGIDAPSDAPITYKQPRKRKAKASDSESVISDSESRYHAINEKSAKQALELNSWSSYREGSATAEYRAAVDAVYGRAEALKAKRDPLYWPEIDAVAAEYAKRLADWTNRYNSVRSSYVSPVIAGGSNYDNRRRSKQNAATDRLMEEYAAIRAIPDRMERIGDPSRPVRLDDPNALNMLERQIADAEREQAMMKAVNAYYRKHGTVIGCPEIPANLQQQWESAIKAPGRASDKPFQDFELSGNREKIKRLKRKQEELAQAKGSGGGSTEYGDIQVIEDTDDMRVRMLFPDKPSEEVRTILKRNGFKWSPSNQAWQRQLNDAGRQAVANVVRQIAGVAGEEYGLAPVSSQNRRRRH